MVEPRINMRKQVEILISVVLMGLFPVVAAAQGESRDITPEIYYLMPEFGQGMIWFSNQGPAEGKMNICAEDNSLRYLDKDGQEVVAASIDNVVKVQIDTAVFIRHEGVFYRIYPVSDEMAVAVRRDLDIQRDAQRGAYGGYSRTSSIREYGTLYADGVAYQLEKSKKYPFTVSETCFLYTGGKIASFSKRTLRKLFPQRKDDIDMYLKSGKSLPEDLSGAQDFLRRLSSGESL
jgi:hypothetical protein